MDQQNADSGAQASPDLERGTPKEGVASVDRLTLSQRAMRAEATTGITPKEACKRFRVPQRWVGKARGLRLRAGGFPEVMEAVERGKITLWTAGEILGKDPEQRAEELGRCLSTTKRRNGKRPRRQPGSVQRPIKRVPATTVSRALSVIAGACSVLREPISALAGTTPAHWQDQLSEILATLRGLKRKLNKGKEKQNEQQQQNIHHDAVAAGVAAP
jgi:hypothetical protein